MKLSALRLREVGRFSEPVEIEGLSGGLDVLIAPNEAGKSTVLKALKAVFFDKHTSTNKDISALQPYGGGAPLVEVDFEAEGGQWRLRKQFLSDRSCSLSDLASARVVARGEEAHARALALFTDGGDGRDAGLTGFLLLEQRTWLDEAAPSVKAQTAIESVLEAELATTAGLSRLRQVLASAREDLAKLLTSHAPPRPTGSYKASIERRDRLRAKLEEAKRIEADVVGRQERLAVLASERTAHHDPVRAAAVAARVRDCAADLEAAGNARERLSRAEAAYREHESAHRLAGIEVARAREQIGELAAIEKSLGELASALSAAENVLQSHLAVAADAQSKHDAAKSRLTAARQALAARHAADRRASAETRSAELATRLSRLAEIEGARERLAGQLRSLPVSGRTLAAAEAEAGAIGALEARLEAGAPVVTFDLLPAAASKIRVDGALIASGEVVRASGPIRIDIEGIGAIAVAPARPADAEEDAADLGAHRRALDGILSGAGAADIDELRSRLARRSELERELGILDGKIEAVAPRGVEALKFELAKLREALAYCSPPSEAILPGRSEAEAAVSSAEREVAGLAREHAIASEAVYRARETATRLKAEIDAGGRRKAALVATLPPPDERRGWLERLTSRLADAERGLREAALERSAWREKAPDEQAFRRLAAAKAAAETEQKGWAERRESLDREIAILDSMLERDREACHEAVSEGFARDLCVAEREVVMQEADAAALKLLIEAASGVERGTRDALLRPVLERAAAYIAPVLPGASIDLRAGIVVSGLSRSGRSEDVGALSQGTREQIAVLVRLGVARLLADSGAPRPLILDDVLVYSDDGRLRGMFENLRTASKHHQVVVLSCRERAFEGLGGNRIGITPWRAT